MVTCLSTMSGYFSMVFDYLESLLWWSQMDKVIFTNKESESPLTPTVKNGYTFSRNNSNVTLLETIVEEKPDHTIIDIEETWDYSGMTFVHEKLKQD